MKKILFLFLACFLLASAAQGTDIPEETIAAGSDDGYEANDGTPNITTTTIYMKDASQEYGGFRFTSIPVPQAATITSASISLYVTTTVNDDFEHTIFAEDTDDAETFTTDANNISGRTHTDSSVSWSVASAGTGYEVSPDISDIVQEIVNRSGWASGQDIAFLIRCETGAKLYVYGYENSINIAKFNCSYTEGAPPAGQVIIIGEKSDFHRPPTAQIDRRNE